jgi:DNA-directed RNA polymerase beta' subunit
LAKPVFHPGFIKKIKKLLEMVCHNCGRVLLDRVSYPHSEVDLTCLYANTMISE